MKAIIKPDLLVLVPETEQERAELGGWKRDLAEHLFLVRSNQGDGLALRNLGERERACNIPVQISSTKADPAARWISNFAPTPFRLDDREYQCVEAFWQGLKFEDESERRRIAVMDGPTARRAGQEKGYAATITYEGRTVVVGTWDHWMLMQRACRAKFGQHDAAREALLSTGERPLEHRMRRDSRTIPGVIMAEIWVKIRQGLRESACRPQAMGRRQTMREA